MSKHGDDGGRFEFDNVARSEPLTSMEPTGRSPYEDEYDATEERLQVHARNRQKMIGAFALAVLAVIMTGVFALILKGIILLGLALALWATAVIAVVVGMRAASKRS